MTAVVAGLSACGRAPKADVAPAEPERPLATYAVHRLIVTPVGTARADSLGWTQRLGIRGMTRAMDSSIAVALGGRGLAERWVLPAELKRAFERNRSYAADPYQLAIEPVRSAKFVTEERYGEPLSSQLRTMIALHEDTRFVLLPIELRFEPVGSAARGVLKVALLDPRYAQARWVGDVKGDAAATAPQALASVAGRVADLFVAP